MIPTLTYCLDILFDILSGIVSGILFGMCSGPGVPSCIRSWQRRSKQQRGGGGGEEGEGEGLEGVAPLLKSRDPHLADGEKNDNPSRPRSIHGDLDQRHGHNLPQRQDRPEENQQYMTQRGHATKQMVGWCWLWLMLVDVCNVFRLRCAWFEVKRRLEDSGCLADDFRYDFVWPKSLPLLICVWSLGNDFSSNPSRFSSHTPHTWCYPSLTQAAHGARFGSPQTSWDCHKSSLPLTQAWNAKRLPSFASINFGRPQKKKLGTASSFPPLTAQGPGNHSTSASNSAHSQHGTSVLEPGPPKMTGTQNTNHHVWLIQIIRVEDLFQVEDL